MSWTKLAVINGLDESTRCLSPQLSMPSVLDLGEAGIRVYATAKSEAGQSSVVSFDLELSSRPRVCATRFQPMLSAGALGAFDDDHVAASCVIEHAGKLLLYYTGGERCQTVPYHFSIGLAVSVDGGQSFQRVSRGPIVPRTQVDPFLTESPCVLQEGDLWRMWSVSATGWQGVAENARPSLRVHYTESPDGIHWKTGRPCENAGATSQGTIGRPCVVRDGEGYRMWYSRRERTRQLVCATSKNGLDWQPCSDDDEASFHRAAREGETIIDPCVFEHAGRRYMICETSRSEPFGMGLWTRPVVPGDAE